LFFGNAVFHNGFRLTDAAKLAKERFAQARVRMAKTRMLNAGRDRALDSLERKLDFSKGLSSGQKHS
jgi:hypothetical protein